MSKVDCKYWDKCYQKNQAHLNEYNHPPKGLKVETEIENNKYLDDQKDKIVSKEENVSDNEPKVKKCKESIKSVPGEPNKDNNVLTLPGNSFVDLDIKQFIRDKFLVEMPNDFFIFWNFIKEFLKGTLATANQKESKHDNYGYIQKYFEKTFQLSLVGPFDAIAGKFNDTHLSQLNGEDYLRHWRFYYDPPEFQTIFVRINTGIHYGYWRDNPKDPETENGGLLLARNDSGKNCEFEFIGGNIFEALLYYLEKDYPSTPFNVTSTRNLKKSLEAFLQKENDVYSKLKLQVLRKKRDREVVVKTFHRAGIVVPVDSKTEVGYRPLFVSDAELKKILQLLEKNKKNNTKPQHDDENIKENKSPVIPSIVLEKLQPVITAATIAMDECDFGTSLELGLDLFSSGYPELNGIIERILIQSYAVLGRKEFSTILKSHLKNRTKSLKLSVIEKI